jgi:hypothetical protein
MGTAGMTCSALSLQINNAKLLSDYVIGED